MENMVNQYESQNTMFRQYNLIDEEEKNDKLKKDLAKAVGEEEESDEIVSNNLHLYKKLKLLNEEKSISGHWDLTVSIKGKLYDFQVELNERGQFTLDNSKMISEKDIEGAFNENTEQKRLYAFTLFGEKSKMKVNEDFTKIEYNQLYPP